MSDNIQKKIGRNKPPRVQITYDLELEGAIIKKELPCVMALIADLTGERSEDDPLVKYDLRKFVNIDPDNFDEVLAAFKPMANMSFGIKEDGTAEDDVSKLQTAMVKFTKIDHFTPDYIMDNIPFLKERYDKRKNLSDLLTRVANNSIIKNAATEVVKNNGASLDDLLKDYKFRNDEQKTYITGLFELLKGMEVVEDSVFLSIQKVIDTLDKELTVLLNQVLHSPSYQKLEASWLGVKYLVQNLEIGEFLKLRVLNASFKEINEDLSRALEFDQSFLFNKLYEEEYGTYGGNPYTSLLIDYYIKQDADDIFFLHKMSEVVSAAHIPTSIGIDPSLFDLENFTKLHEPRLLAKLFQSPELIKFKGFRERDESRYISFVLPKFMARIPFGPKTKKLEHINYTEDVSKHENFCWSNAVYVYGAKIAESFSRYHWFASIIGPENGGMVSNLPVYVFKDYDGESLIKCPTETTITDRREKELSDLGFISLCHCKDSDYSVFFSGQSANKPSLYNKDAANSNARLSARFQYMLNCSRFAHYIKCIMRDKIGTFASKEDVEKFLNLWIADYILAMDVAPQELKAKYPLREASIIVNEVAGKPGCYDSIIYLRPHFQMEELTVSLRLVARIPEVK